MASINMYLNFNGNCEQAFNFYKSVFGGEFIEFQRFKDVPSENPLPEAEGEWLMHVELPIGNGNFLMGSDTPSSMGKVVNGTNYHISIQSDSNEETDRLYKDLSAGGKISYASAGDILGSAICHVYRQVWHPVDDQSVSQSLTLLGEMFTRVRR
jgi:PhnB protein